MVTKYIILANCSVGFEIPRQLTKINGESLIARTIRLLKENGIEDIIITSCDKRFDNLGARRYEPLYNDYNQENPKSHWLKAFPIELMDEPVVYLFGDVYYSENAIKTIIKEDNDDILFFCTYNNDSPKYIKEHDEPLAFKVHNFDKFKFHIDRLIDMWNNDETIRRPITWELYRSINGLDVNVHQMTGNYIAINDESCDIDTKEDIKKLLKKIGGFEMIKVEVIVEFTLERFDEIKDSLVRRSVDPKSNKLLVGDTFVCEKELADYLMGNNEKGKVVVKVIEVIPEKIKDISPKDTKAESENIKSLSTKETLDKLGDELKEYVITEPKPIKKKKTSKK